MSEHAVRMSRAEQTALWQQRLFEAEAGLTRHLTRNGKARHLVDWFRVQEELFAEIPAEDDEEPVSWQRFFFRAQALMERFLVSRFGHSELKAWAYANAEVHRQVERERGAGALGPIRRVAAQAELYGSRYRLSPGSDEQRAAVEIEHCAIWDYREQAQRRGVGLTLASPCEYCTHATTANIAAKGYRPGHRLTEGPDGHGCHWSAESAPDRRER